MMVGINSVVSALPRLKGALEIGLGVIIVILIFVFADQLSALNEFGYVGVFLISMLSTATIFIPAPGWAVVIAMSSILNPLYVGIVAGVGAGFGEITGYMIGNGAANISGAKLERFEKYREWIIKNDLLSIVFLAFIPNPFFDVAGIAAGILGIRWWRFLIACTIGRTLRYVGLAYLGAFSLQYISA